MRYGLFSGNISTLAVVRRNGKSNCYHDTDIININNIIVLGKLIKLTERLNIWLLSSS
jgi:hypothetical protein